jgi:hypothetical protein
MLGLRNGLELRRVRRHIKYMLRIRLWTPLCGALLLFVFGCSSPQQAPIAERVGPAPQAGPAHDDLGYLVVYSAWSNFVDPGSTGHHSRYVVRSDNTSVSREIINHVDRFDEGPIQLPLEPGAYHVRARSSHFGRVSVPVVIEPHRTTVVYLDGRHSETVAAEAKNAVRLPDGEIVGWSATISKNSSR